MIIRVVGKDNTVNVDQDATGEIRVSPQIEVQCDQSVTQSATEEGPGDATAGGGGGTPPSDKTGEPEPKEETKE